MPVNCDSRGKNAIIAWEIFPKPIISCFEIKGLREIDGFRNSSRLSEKFLHGLQTNPACRIPLC